MTDRLYLSLSFIETALHCGWFLLALFLVRAAVRWLRASTVAASFFHVTESDPRKNGQAAKATHVVSSPHV
jgi:TRAP-type C4-dicarboxylate transport system permease small subunit